MAILQPGTVLDGRYRIVKTLARGGFGQTYLAEDLRRPGQPLCVVKHLKPATTDPDFLEAARRLFDKEAEILERLGRHHTQIPRLLANFEQDKEFYLVQDLIEGRVLTEELQPDRPWSEAEILQMLQDVLAVLVYVHREGVIHRDVKPDNLIRRSQDGRLVLVDFGTVKQIRQYPTGQAKASTTIAVGTPGYMPMELFRGKPRPNSDIYALGIIAIQAATGLTTEQFIEDDPAELLKLHRPAQLRDDLIAILGHMVHYRTQERYQSAIEVLQALEPIMQCYPELILPVSYGASTETLSSRHSNREPSSPQSQPQPTIISSKPPPRTIEPPTAPPLAPPAAASSLESTPDNISDTVLDNVSDSILDNAPDSALDNIPDSIPLTVPLPLSEQPLPPAPTIIASKPASSTLPPAATIDSLDWVAPDPPIAPEQGSEIPSILPISPEPAASPIAPPPNPTIVSAQPAAKSPPPALPNPTVITAKSAVVPPTVHQPPQTKRWSKATIGTRVGIAAIAMSLIVGNQYFERTQQTLPDVPPKVNSANFGQLDIAFLTLSLPCRNIQIQEDLGNPSKEESSYKYYGKLNANRLPADGTGTMVFKSGNRYDGEFRNGQYEGCGTYSYKDFGVFAGELRNNQFNGQGMLTFKNGNRYIGEFKNGQCNGEGKFVFADGTIVTGIWQKGNQKDGKLSCNTLNHSHS